MATTRKQGRAGAFVQAELTAILRMILDTSQCRWVTWRETSIIIESRFGAEALRDPDLLVSKASIDLVPVDVEQARIARLAFSRFGKGRHPVCLNFGDCFSPALATVLGEPLLFKGHDFSRTDVAALVGG